MQKTEIQTCAVDELRCAFGHLAIGANEARKPGNTQLHGTGAEVRCTAW